MIPTGHTSHTPEILPAADQALQRFLLPEAQGKREALHPRPKPASSAPAARQADHPRSKIAADCIMPGLGVLDTLIADQSVHDILVNGTRSIFVDRGGVLEDSGLRFASDKDVWAAAESIMDAVGQHWSPERPMIDTRLPDGSRVNIVAPPMAVDGVMISIRKFPAIGITLDRMVEMKQISPELGKFLALATSMKLNIVVSGGTSSGKTTLLNALSSAISSTERIVTIEDCAELRLQQPHVVRLEAKSPVDASKPHTAVTIRDLMRNALRMRPDRIILGECRGPEAFDVLQAMNTGHEGSMTTLHANTPRDALSRLETMVSIAMPNLPTRVVRQQISSAIHLVVQTDRTGDGVRRITHVSELSGVEGETIMMQDLVTFTPASGYRWVAGSSRNAIVTEAARASGMLKPMR